MTTIAKSTGSAEILVREIDAPAEMRAVEELQKEVWGIPDLDVVPLTQLVAARGAGGVLLGAFDGEAMIGFAYGFAGIEHGRTTHHSHMLAVKPKYRNFNVGYRLKCAQREFVLKQGVGEMTWTFDPLQSLNAYFNFTRLGVVSDRYLIDFYGTDAASFLHSSGTDRLWVTWQLKSPRVTGRLEGLSQKPEFQNAVPLIWTEADGSPNYLGYAPTFAGQAALIEIPADISSVQRHSEDMAAEWRNVTRQAFTDSISAGLVVADFARTGQTGTYLLTGGKTLDELGADAAETE